SYGLAAVSIRKVAAALDAGPMRLYGYLATKQDLLDLMVDAVYAEIELADTGAQEWRDTLSAVARTTRQVALRHEWFADLLGGRPHLGPHALAVLETSASALARSPGLGDLDDLWLALGTLNAYVVGAVRREIAERRAARSTGVDKSRWQGAAGPYLRRVFAGGGFPTLARLIHDGAHADPQDAFEQGLTYVLDGIATRPGR
ncbi:MAG: TetR/AcrR family transcriptional regulator C-terminal domain-containing protein, partial [Mycobacteriales bacterium]